MTGAQHPPKTGTGYANSWMPTSALLIGGNRNTAQTVVSTCPRQKNRNCNQYTRSALDIRRRRWHATMVTREPSSSLTAKVLSELEQKTFHQWNCVRFSARRSAFRILPIILNNFIFGRRWALAVRLVPGMRIRQAINLWNRPISCLRNDRAPCVDLSIARCRRATCRVRAPMGRFRATRCTKCDSGFPIRNLRS